MIWPEQQSDPSTTFGMIQAVDLNDSPFEETIPLPSGLMGVFFQLQLIRAVHVGLISSWVL